MKDKVGELIDFLAYLWSFPLVQAAAMFYVAYQIIKICFLLVLWKDIKEEKEACLRRDANNTK